MTGLDWALVVILVLAAAGGTTQGFLASALGFVGFMGGAIAGARLAPMVVSGGADGPNGAAAAIVGAAVLGVLLGVGLQRVGDLLRIRLNAGEHGGFRVGRALDAALGAVFTAALVIIAAWFVSAMVLQTPGVPASWRSEVRHSSVLKRLRTTLPPADDALALLSRFDPLPGFAGPRAAVDAPDPEILKRPGVADGRKGVVRIEGSACGVGIVGTGWVARPGIVVTNQHVIAGEDDTHVIAEVGGQRVEAHAVYADRAQDIAVLAAPGLDAEALRVVEDPESGTSAAILGYPLAGPFKARAARIAAAQTVSGEDSYGNGPIRRRVLPFRGLVQQGNSGGPLVDRRGRVVGTVFASSTSGGQRRGFAVPNEIVSKALQDARSDVRVSTGPCSH
ncbi:MarP family serine protease [Patulibacter minatonensis]|uniref:MarP family serine protease n=1 Tax=Patulibacter minatonensis TaxID=298163 RepID=UPI000479933A|nr:MarP family serine protease [Patulibacter minatonensis]